ncbi:MarR family transcriptional regulator [Apibacter raozihei]|uniref:MarR family winged helix-turn-helix transcriptional regulator n=1 Tax=Apibacter TaxID=1778601 RepID=UPI000FE3BD3D|nr:MULTISPECIES: MarR family transcriptional regulator [Apibacter]
MQTDYKEFFSNITDNDKTGFLLWKVNNYWQRAFKKNFRELDITHSQLLLLFGILWGETHHLEVTQKDLSDKAGIDPMTTSTVLRTLQKKGWIKRKFNKKDSRTRLIYITDEGKKIVDHAGIIIKEFNNSFFEALKEHQKQFQENLITLLMSDEDTKKEFINNHPEEFKKYNINIEK